MSHLWPDGKSIRVDTTEHGKPIRLVMDGEVHTVDQICNRYRDGGSWWNGESEREYIKLTTEDGLLCLIAKDLQDEQWLMIRVYD